MLPGDASQLLPKWEMPSWAPWGPTWALADLGVPRVYKQFVVYIFLKETVLKIIVHISLYKTFKSSLTFLKLSIFKNVLKEV